MKNQSENTSESQSNPDNSLPDSEPGADTGFQIPDVPKPAPAEEIEDWAGEVSFEMFHCSCLSLVLFVLVVELQGYLLLLSSCSTLFYVDIVGRVRH